MNHYLEEELVDKAHELTDLDIIEVSLVGKPANRRKFLLVKNEEDLAESEDKETTKEVVEMTDKYIKLDSKELIIKGSFEVYDSFICDFIGARVEEIMKSDDILYGAAMDKFMYLSPNHEALWELYTKGSKRLNLEREQMRKAEDKGESLPPPGNAEEVFLAKVRETIVKGGDKLKAFDIVAEENPKLYEAYRKETNKPYEEEG